MKRHKQKMADLAEKLISEVGAELEGIFRGPYQDWKRKRAHVSAAMDAGFVCACILLGVSIE